MLRVMFPLAAQPWDRGRLTVPWALGMVVMGPLLSLSPEFIWN
jgi:hypothetical protein